MKKILEKRNDIVFYIKMFPLVKIHPNAYKKSKTIVCKKSLKLLEDAFEKKKIPEPTCKTNAIDENMKLAEKLGITGTPSIILPDGRVFSGAYKADDLLKMILNN